MSGRLVLVRHGQSHGNVERRLDTRPPGAELTELGREQARAFARAWPHEIGMVAHSIAVRASQTAAEIGDERGLAPHELEGIHEAQVGLPPLARRRSRCAARRRRERARGP